ncbi:hypothetical protein J8273_1520 [Carpediemonas membranifera]|uniref:Protein BIG1 n=1 Tax=Carpediemonas membranifera TaxID=201153 RepID=A0A8J6BFQ6_9EUKA|nr:hypothetical protein J8273_1520 [Carpediemonas membranifera]|eukprot:KAG9396522.1 hypothetical protein J8273_1520 [Carpediemonas membranifera]
MNRAFLLLAFVTLSFASTTYYGKPLTVAFNDATIFASSSYKVPAAATTLVFDIDSFRADEVVRASASLFPNSKAASSRELFREGDFNLTFASTPAVRASPALMDSSYIKEKYGEPLAMPETSSGIVGPTVFAVSEKDYDSLASMLTALDAIATAAVNAGHTVVMFTSFPQTLGRTESFVYSDTDKDVNLWDLGYYFDGLTLTLVIGGGLAVLLAAWGLYMGLTIQGPTRFPHLVDPTAKKDL